jgi:hypothetical protein
MSIKILVQVVSSPIYLESWLNEWTANEQIW